MSQNSIAKVYLGEWAPTIYQKLEWAVVKVEGSVLTLEWDELTTWKNGTIQSGRWIIRIQWNVSNNDVKHISTEID